MSERPDDSSLDSASAAPIDTDRLERIETRLATDTRFSSVKTASDALRRAFQHDQELYYS